MKLSSHSTLIRGIGYSLVVIFCIACKKDHNLEGQSKLSTESATQQDGKRTSADLAQTLSQTRTGNVFNNWGGEAIANYWLVATAQHFSADDNSYAYSKKLTTTRSQLPLLLQDFRFVIPSDATIEGIDVRARRFELGKGSITDYFATLVRRIGTNERGQYGVWFANPNIYPGAETEIVYSQGGSGINGSTTGNVSYQWTPAMINDPAFGVRIANAKPVGTVVVYYDLVDITVRYSLP